MDLKPNSVGVGAQCRYEHLHTILYNPFFISVRVGVCVGVGVGQCEHAITQNSMGICLCAVRTPANNSTQPVFYESLYRFGYRAV